ncbi:MAG: hypothetical protein ABI835_10020 [Chloroflexota bacterium]
MKRRLLVAIALILSANALYAPYINRIMMCDEANTLFQYSSNLLRALLSYATPNNHMLHSALVWTVTNLAGTSTVAVRFTALASALIATALMFRVGSRLAGMRAGVAAAAFLITNLAFADFAVNARGYSLSVMLTLLLIDRLFLTEAIYSRRYRYSLMAISFALILLLPSMLMLIAAAGVWIVWRGRTQRRYRSLLAPLITGVAVAAAFYAPAFLQGVVSEHLNAFGETDLLVLLQLCLEQLFGTPGIGLLFAGSCVAGVAVLARRYRLARQTIVTVVGVTVLVAIAQMIVLHKLFYARNYLFLIAPVALLGGVGFSRMARRWTTALAVVVLVGSSIPLRALDGDYLEKQVLARVEQNVGAHDQIAAGPCFNAPIQYHLLHNGESEKLFTSPETERVFVLVREGTYEDVLGYYAMQDKVTACQPVTDGSWSPFEVYTCQPIAP